ncbi:MAG: hypothetical protein ACK54A_07670 [Sphingobacteriales bacterium]
MVDYQQLYEQGEVINQQQSLIIDDLKTENAIIRYELAQLKKMIFGSRHERFATTEQNPAQLTLGVQADEVNATHLSAAK